MPKWHIEAQNIKQHRAPTIGCANISTMTGCSGPIMRRQSVIPNTSSLTKFYLLVVRRVLKQLGDLCPDKLLIIPGCMGTQAHLRYQTWQTRLPVHINTSFADCKELEDLNHLTVMHTIVPSVSWDSNRSENQFSLNISNVTLTVPCQNIVTWHSQLLGMCAQRPLPYWYILEAKIMYQYVLETKSMYLYVLQHVCI